MLYYCQYVSPIGELLLTGDGTHLTGVYMNHLPPENGENAENQPLFQAAAQWLDAYFRGEDSPITFPLEPEGTAFQKKVWEILREIPWGSTRSYGEIAREMADILGKKNMSAQAVGGAVGSNPISILIPCHRLVGAKGQLTGYAAGLDKKSWLLRHEGWQIQKNRVLETKE